MHSKEIDITQLKPYKKNPRKISDEAINAVAKSIAEFGFRSPIIADEKYEVIAGHTRLKAAQRLGLTQVPVHIVSGLDKKKIKALRLADNKVAELSEWDDEMLKTELADIDDDELMEQLGFDVEIDVDVADMVEEGEGEEPQPEAVTVLGDVWQLGPHRLICGDSTSADVVAALLGDAKPVLMVTDPPYGVNHDPEWREGSDLGVGKRTKGKVLNDDQASWPGTYALFPGDVAYVWHAATFSATVANDIQACGFEIKSQIIWAKQHFALSRGDYHWQHEPAWYAVKKGAKHNWQGARDQSTLWEIKNNNSFGNSEKEETWGHGTQKPLECMARPIQNNTEEGEGVYDPFCGSGTTLIAAEKLGRVCYACELSPQYCDVIIRRWQKESKQDAVHTQTGKAFNELQR